MKQKKLVIAINSAPNGYFYRSLIEHFCIKSEIEEIECHFFIGRPSVPEEKVGNIVYLNCEGSYEALSLKMIAYLKYLEANYDYDFLFKLDQNTYFDAERLLDLAKTFKSDYVGKQHKGPLVPTYHFAKVKDKKFAKPYSEPWRGPYAHGGPGYFLSRQAVQALLCSLDQLDPELEFYEDKFIGDSLARLGFKLDSQDIEFNFYSRATLVNRVATIKCRQWYRFCFLILVKEMPNIFRLPFLSLVWGVVDLFKKIRPKHKEF